jgi:preprotein translocase subunit SecF
MEFFKPNSLNFKFTKYFKIFGIGSTVLTLVALVAIFSPGLNFGIDFRGGIEAQVSFHQDVTVESLREQLGGKLRNVAVVKFNDTSTTHDFSITAQADDKENVAKILQETLSTKFGESSESSWVVKKLDVVGPKVGASLKKSALLSLVFTCLLITLYMYWRFDMRFSPGALFCIFHDLAVVTGLVAILGIEFTTTTVAALLTLAGYSINDTVVVYDRIRELESNFKGRDKTEMINFALNTTLSRTIMTAGTTLICCIVLYLTSGSELRDFAFILFIGILIGTYSSIFVASPLYLWSDRRINAQNNPSDPTPVTRKKARA